MLSFCAILELFFVRSGWIRPIAGSVDRADFAGYGWSSGAGYLGGNPVGAHDLDFNQFNASPSHGADPRYHGFPPPPGHRLLIGLYIMKK